ncbi:glycosyltransferase [Algihabitans albus]|uniref:glycosyltransferase n=1 Tax=Algihabitans albus TaxID=2164067 RepID=UPI000E5D1D86|nr:glycosyltransferase [Algihabitans albus]
MALLSALAGMASDESAPPFVQRAVVSADWTQALSDSGVGQRTAPYRSFLDLVTRRRIADELAIVRPDLLLIWGAEAARALDRPRAAGSKAVRLGILLSYEEIAPFAHAGAKRLVAPTQDLVDYAREQGWPADEVGLLAPVVPEPAVGVPADPLLRQRWDTPEGVDLVAVPARDRSGTALLLDAWTELPDVWLWLLPCGRKTKRLKKAIRQAGLTNRVRLVDDAEAAVTAADLAVIARQDDPIGLPVVACWAAARATIALAAPGPAALIGHDRDGLLVAPDDPRALALAVDKLLMDPLQADRLAAAGRTAYEQGYGAAKATERWQLTLEVLAGPPPGRKPGDAGTDIRV